MQAALLVGEDLRKEQPLIELAAFLGALLFQRPFRIELRAGRQQRRIALRRGRATTSETRRKRAPLPVTSS